MLITPDISGFFAEVEKITKPVQAPVVEVPIVEAPVVEAPVEETIDETPVLEPAVEEVPTEAPTDEQIDAQLVMPDITLMLEITEII